MKFFLVLALLAASTAAELISPKLHRSIPTPRHGEIKEGTFTTRLDHVNPRDTRTVNFTYELKDDYFHEDGPIYIFIQEPDGFTDEFLETGLIHDLAIETGAALATANQRYYRKNIPTENATTENLEFLTTDQIVNDVAYLVRAVRAALPGSENSRVILFGSGFGATIATWARQKFPNLIYGAWASSGIFHQIVHSDVPLQVLSNTIRRIGGDECANNLNEAYLQASEITLRRRDFERLQADFQTCLYPNPSSSDDVALLFGGITKLLTDYISIYNANGIRNLCTDIAVKNTTIDFPEFDAYARWVRHIFTDEFCVDVSFRSRVYEAATVDWESIRNLAWSDSGVQLAYPIPSRSTLWLRCTQLGGFQTTVNSDSLFGHVVAQDAFFHFCNYVFEDFNYEHLAGAVDNINVRYGSRSPGVSHVIYTNGELDLLRLGGVLQPQNQTEATYVFNIENYGKSADLYSINPYADSPELIETKEYIVQILTEWGDINYH